MSISLEPNIPKRQDQYGMKTCTKCKVNKPKSYFIETRSWFYADGLSPVCNTCIKEHLIEENWSWDAVDRICQVMNIPFLPKKFEELHAIHLNDCFPIYAKFFMTAEYEPFHWKDYFNKFLELKNKSKLDLELPVLNSSYYDDLKLRWGHNYDNEQLVYLENLYNGLLASQNIVGALQQDQAQKLCKISLEIDERIRAGMDFDKLMGSYEKMTKVADFTPKNARSDSDFSSMGEITAWLEKRGWLNPWYDNANKDIVDEVIHSMQSFVQRLYVNEPGIGEEVNERIAQLKLAEELEQKDAKLDEKHLGTENPFFEMDEVNLEERDNQAYEELLVEDVLGDNASEV